MTIINALGMFFIGFVTIAAILVGTKHWKDLSVNLTVSAIMSALVSVGLYLSLLK